eukprot:gene6934-30917_t
MERLKANMKEDDVVAGINTGASTRSAPEGSLLHRVEYTNEEGVCPVPTALLTELH